MIISMILGWATLLLCAFAALKFVARKSQSRKMNDFFRKIHIPLGIGAIVAGLIHGLLAGNLPQLLTDRFVLAPVLFTFNMGTLCFIVIIFLYVSFLFRKQLKKYWMYSHRALTIAMVVLIVLHLLDVGIQLPSSLMYMFGNDTVQKSRLEILNNAPKNKYPSIHQYNNINDSDIITDNNTEVHVPNENPELQTSGDISFSGAVLKDGVYKGTARGYRDMIKVTVTVEDNQVASIKIEDNMETPQYFNYAKSIVDNIIDDQTLEVDAVSGATYSSQGILNAVYDALQDAVVGGELKINSISIGSSAGMGHSGGHRGGHKGH